MITGMSAYATFSRADDRSPGRRQQAGAAEAPRTDADPASRPRQGRARSSPPGSYTVAEVAARYRVGEDKVRGWIRRGELVAVNVASALCGRPQLRITAEALAAFEGRRSACPPPSPVRRRRRTAQVDYYPG
jgi:hypothetical protein